MVLERRDAGVRRGLALREQESDLPEQVIAEPDNRLAA